jgi:formylglycine-generating enzyme required for sulfatase activity
MKLVYIAPAEFLMGSPENEQDRMDDEFQHSVRLTKGFYLGVTEVTQGQWQAVMDTNRSAFPGDANRPIDMVSWEHAVAFCQKLSEREGKEYRLPTEAEWEYACRAGTTTRFSFGDQDDALYRYGNCRDGSTTNGLQGQDLNNRDGHENTAPVGSYQCNGWGLYDMHGNVWEWCADWYDPKYPSGTVADPSGPASGTSRVLRGGSWSRHSFSCRSARRYARYPSVFDPTTGFRVVYSPLSGLR